MIDLGLDGTLLRVFFSDASLAELALYSIHILFVFASNIRYSWLRTTKIFCHTLRWITFFREFHNPFHCFLPRCNRSHSLVTAKQAMANLFIYHSLTTRRFKVLYICILMFVPFDSAVSDKVKLYFNWSCRLMCVFRHAGICFRCKLQGCFAHYWVIP